MNWNELSIYEKANLMKLYVANGITDLNTIKEHYNSFQDGGGTKKPRGYRVSSAIMNIAHKAVDKNAAGTIDTPDNGAPQSTFLMNRKNQQKVFEDEGYTKVDNNDYGPVANAVNTSRHKDVPVYQKYPDVNIDKNNLQKIGTFMDYAINNANTETSVYNGPVESYLTDPANFPVDVYIDRKTGKVYNQGWDYNDYNNIRSTTGVSKLKNVAGNILDRIGNPTVVTTGLQENTVKSSEADKYLQSKNPMLSYQKNEDTGEYEIMMKPITVTAKRTNPVKSKTELRPASELNADEFWDMMEANSKQNGGSLGKITPYGQWQYPHQITTIPSNNITMKGVDYPVIGVSNTGDTKYMLPNMDYLFDGQYVTEYPIHKFQIGGLTAGSYPLYNVPFSDTDDKTWLKWWYSGRPNQIGNAYREYDISYNNNKNPRSLNEYSKTGLEDINKSIDIAIKTPINFTSLKDNTLLGEYIPDGEAHIDIRKVQENHPSTVLHERIHAMNENLTGSQRVKSLLGNFLQNPILMQISPKSGTVDYREKLNGSVDGYWDNANEIYSRLMQFRRDSRTSPSKKWNEEEIINLRKNKELEKYNLNGYTNEFILHLLNDVATNNKDYSGLI